MNTCGTCKYFGKHIDKLDDWDSDVGPIPNKYHKCELLKHLNADTPAMKEPIAGVMDGSGYYAAFCVSEEFGCNRWEARS